MAQDTAHAATGPRSPHRMHLPTTVSESGEALSGAPIAPDLLQSPPRPTMPESAAPLQPTPFTTRRPTSASTGHPSAPTATILATPSGFSNVSALSHPELGAPNPTILALAAQVQALQLQMARQLQEVPPTSLPASLDYPTSLLGSQTSMSLPTLPSSLPPHWTDASPDLINLDASLPPPTGPPPSGPTTGSSQLFDYPFSPAHYPGFPHHDRSLSGFPHTPSSMSAPSDPVASDPLPDPTLSDALLPPPSAGPLRSVSATPGATPFSSADDHSTLTLGSAPAPSTDAVPLELFPTPRQPSSSPVADLATLIRDRSHLPTTRARRSDPPAFTPAPRISQSSSSRVSPFLAVAPPVSPPTTPRPRTPVQWLTDSPTELWDSDDPITAEMALALQAALSPAPPPASRITHASGHPSDRAALTLDSLPQPLPIRIYFICRAHIRDARGSVLRWRIRLEEAFPGAFAQWSICIPPGTYIYKDFGVPLCVLGFRDHTPFHFVFPLRQNSVWASQHITDPSSVAATLEPCYLNIYLSRGPRAGGFLHPYYYGVPGLLPTTKRSRQPYYLPTAVFEGDGTIVASSWSAAFYRGASACHFCPQGGSVPMKAFPSEADLLAYARHTAPTTISRPAITPYIQRQLHHLDLLYEADLTGHLFDPITVRGHIVGKKTPQLYVYNLEARTDTWWNGPIPMDTFISTVSVPPSDSLPAANQGPSSTDLPLNVVGSHVASSGLSTMSECLEPEDHASTAPSTAPSSLTHTYDSTEERERRLERSKDDVPALPFSAQDIHSWVDNLPWLLSGDHWCHEDVHACEIMHTTPANKTLSQDFLSLIKRSAVKHKSDADRRAAQDLLSETINGVNGMQLIKLGQGFELFQQRVKTAYSRGLGTETVDALWTYVHAIQLSGETIGAFFRRLDQLYELVKLTDGCDLGDVTRKTLALQGLKHGSYQEVLAPWVKKVLIGQGKLKLSNSNMGDIQSAATDLLTTSKFYKHNVIQPGRPVAKARAATLGEDAIGRQVTTPSSGPDVPSSDPIIEDIVKRLRTKKQLTPAQTKHIRKTYSCIHCFAVDGHHTLGCRALKEEFYITRQRPKSGPHHPNPASGPDSTTTSSTASPSSGSGSSSGGSSQPTARQASSAAQEESSKTPADTATAGELPSSLINTQTDKALDDIVDLFDTYDTIATEDTDLAHAIAQVAARRTDSHDRLEAIVNQHALKPKPLADKIVARVGHADTKWFKKSPTKAPNSPPNAWKKPLQWGTAVKDDLAKVASSLPMYSSTPRILCPDSGATSTMSPHRDMFITYEDIRAQRRVVRLGDESQRILIHGIGSMALTVAGRHIVYTDVLHVPQLTAILLSTRVHRRVTAGCSFLADNSGCYLTYPSFIIDINDTDDCTIDCVPTPPRFIGHDFDAREYINQHSSSAAVRRCHRLKFDRMMKARSVQAFPVTEDKQHPSPSATPGSRLPPQPIYSVADSGGAPIERINATDLKRLFGCRTIKNWTHLEDTGTGIRVLHDNNSPTVLGDVATIRRNRHGKLLNRPDYALHTVGMDIGYGEGTSPGGFRYALTLVDYCTRHTWVYGLKTKSAESVIDALWTFFLDAGSAPTRIRCDFDASFVKGKVHKFLTKHRVKVSSSPPNRQSQNGLVERQWQTAVSMARSLLVEARLPRRYWYWALREAVISMNILPCKPRGPRRPPSPPDPPFPPDPSLRETAQPVSVVPLPSSLSPVSPASPSPPSVPTASPQLTTPFELYYGIKPDYRTLFHWGSIGYFRPTLPSGKFDTNTRVGIALGRSNQTNAMIFWDADTGRMNVSADYKLDPMASVTQHFPTLTYDGQILPLILRGGKHSDKEPFPPGSDIRVLHNEEYHKGIIQSVPLKEDEDYVVVFKDSPQPYQVPLEQITSDAEPIFHMLSVDPDEEITNAPPTMPEWITDDTPITLHHQGRNRRGKLVKNDKGWSFEQRTTKGRVTLSVDLTDLPITWQERLTEGSMELGWQAQVRAYHVSAKGLKLGVPPSFRRSMEHGYPDRKLWIESYLEEISGLAEQDTYTVITAKEYSDKYSQIQLIPTMNVQTVKKDENGDPCRVKSRIVALGNFEERVWEKCEKYAPVLRDESARLMTSMAVGMGRREKQGDCKNAFVQSYLPKDETIIVRPPKGCPVSKPGDLWLLKKTLYGLRRSPYHWYQKIMGILLDMGLTISPHDPCVFSGKIAAHLPPLYLGLYVDDFKFFSQSDETEKLFEEKLKAKCQVEFMGEVSWFLGCKYEWENLPDGRLTVSITQTAKTEDLIESHGMHDCNKVDSPYRSGLTIDRIPDDGLALTDKAELIKKYQSVVGVDTTQQQKRVLAYLQGTLDRGIRYTQGGSPVHVNVAFPLRDGGYTDANWGPQDASHPKPGETVEIEDAQSLLGHVVMRMGGPICWGCMRETESMSLSSCESEIYATNEGTKSIMSIRNLMQDLDLPEGSESIPVWNDNSGCVDWTKGVSVSRKLRHVNMRELAVRLYQRLGYVSVHHIEGKQNIADIFTKEIKDVSHFRRMAFTLTTPRLLEHWDPNTGLNTEEKWMQKVRGVLRKPWRETHVTAPKYQVPVRREISWANPVENEVEQRPSTIFVGAR